jgi:hypothetical protein
MSSTINKNKTIKEEKEEEGMITLGMNQTLLS